MKNVFPVVSGAPQPRFGNRFVTTICCGNGILEEHEGCMIFHCAEHMTLCIKDGEVLAARTNGIRQ